MRSFFMFVVLLLVLITASALLMPPVYHLVDLFVSDPRPDRIARNIGKLLLVISMILMIRYLSFSKVELGYQQARKAFLHGMFQGWLIGLIILIALVIPLWAMEVLVYRPAGNGELQLKLLLKAIIGGILSGIAIGLLEETFFRGMIYSAIKKQSGLIWAMLLSSFLYAILHFLKTQPHPTATAIQWDSGIILLPSIIDHMTSIHSLDSMLALFIAGIFLVLVREITGSLAMSIGIHAGWVTVIKTTKYLTDNDENTSFSWLVGDYDGITGLLAVGLLTILSAMAYVKLKKQAVSQPN